MTYVSQCHGHNTMFTVVITKPQYVCCTCVQGRVLSMSWCSEYCNSLRMSMLFLTDSFLSLSILGQLSEAHWLWFRSSSSGSGGGGILVPGIVPPGGKTRL